MTKITRTIIAATASLGLLLPLTGCGSAEGDNQGTVPENVAEEPAETDQDIDAESNTDEGEDTTDIEEAELPSEWPSDLPLPKDHLIVQIDDHRDSGRMPGITAIFAAPGDAEEVDEQIRSDMAAADYQESDSGPVDMDGGGFIIRKTSYEAASHSVSVYLTDMSISGLPEELRLAITYTLTTRDGQ